MAHCFFTHPHLRLAGRNDESGTDAVVREMREASVRMASDPTFDPADPRWTFAVRAHNELQGAVLSPERRQRLLSLAVKLGMTSFEAGMIMALVQDHARRDRPLTATTALLRLIPAETSASTPAWVTWRWVLALNLAALGCWGLVQWLLVAS